MKPQKTSHLQPSNSSSFLFFFSLSNSLTLFLCFCLSFPFFAPKNGRPFHLKREPLLSPSWRADQLWRASPSFALSWVGEWVTGHVGGEALAWKKRPKSAGHAAWEAKRKGQLGMCFTWARNKKQRKKHAGLRREESLVLQRGRQREQQTTWAHEGTNGMRARRRKETAGWRAWVAESGQTWACWWAKVWTINGSRKVGQFDDNAFGLKENGLGRCKWAKWVVVLCSFVLNTIRCFGSHFFHECQIGAKLISSENRLPYLFNHIWLIF